MKTDPGSPDELPDMDDIDDELDGLALQADNAAALALALQYLKESTTE